MNAPATWIIHLADALGAAHTMQAYVTPVVRAMCVLAALVCVAFLVNGGFHYMTSSGHPEKLEQAKRVIRNALLGLVIVLAAATLTSILSHAYSGSHSVLNQQLPSLTAIPPKPVSNGLIDIIIKAITGLLNNIIQSVASPFLKALSLFTTSTPMMTANSAVFNLWLTMVGITDALFVLVVALLGFHVMSLASFGFDELDLRHLLPKLSVVFLLVNISIFAIDGIISLSNAMIHALNVGLSNTSVWDVLTTVVKQTSEMGVAALLIMIAFVVLSVILLVYYVGRLVTLYIGAVLSPLIMLLWLVPGFRDFSESAAKVYLTTIFVLFVHVVILELAASLFTGLIGSSVNHVPDALMAMVVGLATLIALLKTQGLMMQFSYAASGARSARKLGSQFITGISYVTGKGKGAVDVATGKSRQSGANPSTPQPDNSKGSSNPNAASGTNSPKRQLATGTTYTAPTSHTNTSSTRQRQRFDPRAVSFAAEDVGFHMTPPSDPTNPTQSIKRKKGVKSA